MKTALDLYFSIFKKIESFLTMEGCKDHKVFVTFCCEVPIICYSIKQAKKLKLTTLSIFHAFFPYAFLCFSEENLLKKFYSISFGQ